MTSLRLLVAWGGLVLIAVACNHPASNDAAQVKPDSTQVELSKADNGDSVRQTKLSAPENAGSAAHQAEAVDLVQDSLTIIEETSEAGEFNCAPKNYNPRILSSADPDSIHPDWKSREVGLSWTILATEKISNSKGVFLVGDLITPRGGRMEGPFYVIFSEWECSGN